MRKMNLKSTKQAALLLALATALSVPVLAQSLHNPLIPVTEEFKLPNGLRCVLSEDHSLPVASVVLIYDVGSRDEAKGRSGFAHLFEHMMFEGSANVGKMEHFKLIQSNGGSCNASTHNDHTIYYDRLPSNQINLALWLESDRMRSLAVTPENFKNQLETVKEEKRQSIDNRPYEPANQKADELIFDNWSNGHAVIGTFEDLDASSIDDVRNFFKTYYAPNNCVLAVVGDIDHEQVHKQIEKYFGDIASQPKPARPDLTEPVQTKPKYLSVPDEHAKLPAFWMAWKAPARRDPDAFALKLIQKMLSEGESSRLYQRMVKGDQIAVQAGSGYDTRRGPGSFSVFVIFKPNTTAQHAREVVWNEIDKLKSQPVSKEELDKVKNQYLRSLFSSNGYTSIQKTTGRATLLAEYALYYGNPSLFDQDVKTLMSVAPEDIQRVANKYFTKDGISVIDVVPSEQKASLPQHAHIE